MSDTYLKWAARTCVAVGVALIALDLVRAFIVVPLANQPNPGTGILLLTVGLIGLRLLRP